jgi:hypothetical protein
MMVADLCARASRHGACFFSALSRFGERGWCTLLSAVRSSIDNSQPAMAPMGNLGLQTTCVKQGTYTVYQ